MASDFDNASLMDNLCQRLHNQSASSSDFDDETASAVASNIDGDSLMEIICQRIQNHSSSSSDFDDETASDVASDFGDASLMDILPQRLHNQSATSSDFDGAYAAIDIVKNQCLRIVNQSGWDFVIRLRESVNTFDYEFSFLVIFLNCIHKWTDLEDVLHLGSLMSKVEETIRKIETKLTQNNKESLLERSEILSLPIFIILRKFKDQRLQRKVSALNDLFTDFINEVMELKMEIGEAFRSLSLTAHSFDFRFDNDWSNFSNFVNKYKRAWNIGGPAIGERSEFLKLNDRLLKTKAFLDHAARHSFSYLKPADFMIHFGKVAISAALRLCEWWAVQEADQVNVRFSLLELQRKIDLTNPEFLDLNLELLKEDGQGQGLNFLVCAILSYLPKYMVDAFVQELDLLMMSAVKGDDRDVQRYFVDVKVLLLTEVPKLFKSNNAKVRVSSIARNLLQEIWLLKVESFLRRQLRTNLIFEMPKQIMSLAKELSDLNYDKWVRSLILNTRFRLSRRGNIKVGKQISTLKEEIGKVSASLHHSTDAEEIIIEEERVRNELLRLISMIVLFKANSLFINFHNSNNHQRVMDFDKYQIEVLQKGLHFLMMFVEDQSVATVKEAKGVIEQIHEVACVLTFLFSSLATNKIKQEAIDSKKIGISDVLEKIRHIMIEVKYIYFHVSRINFPKTNGMGFMDLLFEKVGELQKANEEPATEEPEMEEAGMEVSLNLQIPEVSLNHQIEEILENLKFLKPFLRYLELDIHSQELDGLGARIIDMATEAEYYIDWMMLEGSVNWKRSLWLCFLLLDDMIHLKSSITTVYDKTQHAKAHIMRQTSVRKDQKASTSTIQDIVVVLNDQEKMIFDRLIGGTSKLEIVPIVGMPGIGKTTLARRVYSSPAVVAHFHIHAWCCVSEIYRKREVLLEILSNIMPLTDKSVIGMTDEDLENKLRQLLLKNKYLVVLDDMWNSEALDDLGNALPNDGNGSRILITSRNHRIANKADPHSVRQLSDAESWNLLQMKIFQKEEVPKGLRVIGEQIASSCKGLPLAIAAVAGLLQKRERQDSSWKEIAEDLSSRIVDDPNEHCRQILELSYENLPYYLKACFLYFGAFLEDKDISARKLLQLWIAEGFVRQSDSKSLEDVAEDYLMDLIDRSLVLFSQQRSRGGVKACRVHDVLRNLCLTKAKDAQFLRVIMSQSDESNASLHDLGYVISANSSRPSSVTYEDYRLCYCSKRDHFIESRPSGPHVRSLLCFASGDEDPKCPYDISFVSQNFRFLKVLDLECINLGTSFPSGIELLVFLRYLAVSGYIGSVPSSIANLWNLEILVVKGLKLKGRVNLPNSIWRLKKLRHLHVTDIAVISLQDEQLGSSEGPYYLVTLSSLFLPFGEDTNKMLSQFLNLQKLKCVFSKSWDNSQGCNLFPSLGALVKLESLKISYYGQAVHPGEFSFPLNLKKLTLSEFRLPWNKISVIGQLPNLEILKLLNRSFDGECWDMVEGEFSELKYLKLDTLNIVNWNADPDHLPKLQHLALRCCKHLKEVPSSFGEISTLNMINIQWCGEGVEESVKKIMEDGYGNLRVFINFAEKD